MLINETATESNHATCAATPVTTYSIVNGIIIPSEADELRANPGVLFAREESLNTALTAMMIGAVRLRPAGSGMISGGIARWEPGNWPRSELCCRFYQPAAWMWKNSKF